MILSIDTILKNLSNNKDIKKIFSKVSDPSFMSLPFSEKKALFIKYNTIIESELNTLIKIYINKSEEREKNKYRTTSLSIDNSIMVIDGLNENPYFYLRDILLMHLIYLNDDKYCAVNIGNISFNSNYLDMVPNLSLYNAINIRAVEKVNRFMDEMLSEYKNPYISEYKQQLDNVLTDEGRRELITSNDILDDYCTNGILEPLDRLFNYLERMFDKEKLSIKEVALLSLNDVYLAYLSNAAGKSSKDNFLAYHYKQFVRTFFREYSDDIKIKYLPQGIFINGRCIYEDELLLDVLLQQIAMIERNNPRIDKLVSDEELIEFNKGDNKYAKLDVYFIKSLTKLDELLANRNLELINYMSWTKLYKDPSRENIFDSSIGIFEKLVVNKEFLSTIDNILTAKPSKLEDYFKKLMKMMNEVYGSDFEIKVITNVSTDTSMGSADHDKSIYLNVSNNIDRIALLATFFHEFRHLMQYREMKENTGIYSDKFYQLIKLNTYETPFKKDYNYASCNTCSYDNTLFYYMQPIELDAEDFSKAMVSVIFVLLGKKEKVGKMSFADTYTSCVYFDREKISLESYKSFLKIDDIEKTVKDEEKDYCILMDAISKADCKDDAIKIFKFRNFVNLEMKEKAKVYFLLMPDGIEFSYDEKECLVHLGHLTFSTKNTSDFELLEQILILEAKDKIKKLELKISDYYEYIYNESRKYKTSSYDIFNCFQAYDYHVCFDKYYRGSKQEKTKKRRKN